jgi:hypothetical protein
LSRCWGNAVVSPLAISFTAQTHSFSAATALKRNLRPIHPSCSIKIPFTANVPEVLNAAAHYPGQIIKNVDRGLNNS